METKKNIFKNPIVVSLLAIFCCALWGSATPAIKIGSSLLIPEPSTASTILFAGVRFTFAGLLTVIIYIIGRRRVLIPRRENVGRILLVAAFQTVIQYIFFYVGLNNTSGVKGTVLSGTSAFFSVLISALIFRLERLTPKKIIACVLGFAGIIVVNLKDLDFNMNFTGDAFVIFSAIAVATSSVLMKVFSKHEDPVVISGYQFIAGGIVMVGIGLAFGGKIEISSFGAFLILLYLSALSAVAYALWGMLLKFNPVSKVTIFSFMTPVFGTILSLIFLSEDTKVSYLNLAITLVLVAGGIFLINYVSKKQPLPEIKEETREE
jgi:drug/metabolite transporter (DMT)-like permease